MTLWDSLRHQKEHVHLHDWRRKHLENKIQVVSAVFFICLSGSEAKLHSQAQLLLPSPPLLPPRNLV